MKLMMLATASLLGSDPGAGPPRPAPAHAMPPATHEVLSFPAGFYAEFRPATALDMVLKTPGFNFDPGNATRGLASAAGNVIVNGRWPTSKNDTLEEILKRLPAATVERIELLRGATSGVDMRGRSVLANVVVRRDQGFTGALTVSSTLVSDGRTEGSARAEGRWRWGEHAVEVGLVGGRGAADWLGPGTRRQYGPAGQLAVASRLQAEGEGVREWATAAYDGPVGGGALRLNGAFKLTPSDLQVTDRLPGGGQEREHVTDGLSEQEIGLRFTRGAGRAREVETLGLQQWSQADIRVRFEAPGLRRDFRLRKDTSESILRGTIRNVRLGDLNLESGLEAARNVLDSDTRFAVNGAAIPLPAANVEVREDRLEAFLVASRPWRGLDVEASLRQEISQLRSRGDVDYKGDYAFTKPRLAITRDFGKAQQLRLSAEREVAQLDFDDFVASSALVNSGTILAGNPRLTPQQSWVLEASYERRFWTGGVAALTVRYAELRDVIDRAPIVASDGAVVDAPGNIGDGHRTDVRASLALPLARLGVPGGLVKGNMTRRTSRVTDPVTSRSREISGVQPLSWEASFSQDLPRWRTSWGVEVKGGYRERFYRVGEIDTVKYEPFVTLYGEREVGPRLMLRVELQNLTRRPYRRVQEFYDARRTPGPAPMTDVREMRFGRGLYVRLRRTMQ